MSFEIKDSGARTEYASGMMRDKAEDKTEYWSMRIGPMYRRWAELLTKGRKKYPDTAPGVPNWTLGEGEAEYLHAKESFTRHCEAYLAGQTDEDHAAAMFFNINLMEYIKEKMALAADFEASTDADAGTFIEAVQEELVGIHRRSIRGAGTYIGDPAEDPAVTPIPHRLGPVGYRSENDDSLPPIPHDIMPEDALRLREYKERMARERAVLMLPIDAQTAP